VAHGVTVTTPPPRVPSDEALRELAACLHDVAGVAERKTVMTSDLAQALLDAREAIRHLTDFMADNSPHDGLERDCAWCRVYLSATALLPRAKALLPKPAGEV